MKVKERKDMTKLRLNGGELNIAIDRKGNVLEWAEDCEDGYKAKWMIALSAKELDAIAAVSAATATAGRLVQEAYNSLQNLPELPGYTQTADHEIECYTYMDSDGSDLDGSVTFGCQNVSPEDVARVHALSRKARGLKPVK